MIAATLHPCPHLSTPSYSGRSLVQLIYPSSVRGFAPVRLMACSAPK